MEQLIAPNYGDGNRAFLQAFMARGTLTFEEAKSIIAEIRTADDREGAEFRADQVDQAQFQRHIDIASQAVSLFDYEIRSGVHQLTKQQVYALVNTTSDPQTQLATTHSAEELSFIKRILDAMFDKYNTPRMEVMAITQMEAMRFARPARRQSQAEGGEEQQLTQQPSTDKGLKHSEVEDVLANLANGGWLEKSREGYYSLSQRGLLELRPWLIETYNDPDVGANEWQRIKFCEACRDLVTMGRRCADPDCNFRLHDVCEDAFWRSRPDKKCPKCSKDWSGQHYVGERSRTKTEAYQRGRGRQAPAAAASDEEESE